MNLLADFLGARSFVRIDSSARSIDLTESEFASSVEITYTGTVTSQMCKDLASRIDSTGLNVDLSKLPVACAGKHAESVSEHIKMKRRNTIQRDAMHASIKDEHLEHHVHA